MQRKSLTDILRAGELDSLRQRWATTKPAADFGLLPLGNYICHITNGGPQRSRVKQSTGYSLEFTVIDGEFMGRKVWKDFWFTGDGLAIAQRELAKLGVTSIDMLDRPLPQGIRCRVRIVLDCKDDDGIERNKVKSFDVIGIDTPARDPFAPPEIVPGDVSDAAEPAGDCDTSFPPATEGGPGA